jgi:MFS transporter, DHA3 family, macrolide efflux protein
MRVFLLVWFGQVISLIGSELTQFALGVWALEKTGGAVTQFALISLFIYLPQVIISPIAGALVDRWNRRLCMMLGDALTGVVTIAVTVLVYSDLLEIWHIYVAVIVGSIFKALHWPAYAASTTQLVPKQHLARANGLIQASQAAAKLISPTMAGILVTRIQIEGVLLTDLVSCSIAVFILALVRFPRVDRSQSDRQNTKIRFNHIWGEISSAWNYISGRQGLLCLLGFFAILSWTEGILQIVFWPLVLSFSTPQDLGFILSASGCGMLLGSVVMSTWGGPKKRMYGILSFVGLQGIILTIAGARAFPLLFAVCGFGYLFAAPIVVSCNQTIWQNKVPVELQGRVFALRQTIEKSLAIVAYITTGPLIDKSLEPLMAVNGALANTIIGKLIGTGHGRGIALLLIAVGVINVVSTIVAYQLPQLRRLEKDLPDTIDEAIPVRSTTIG